MLGLLRTCHLKCKYISNKKQCSASEIWTNRTNRSEYKID